MVFILECDTWQQSTGVQRYEDFSWKEKDTIEDYQSITIDSTCIAQRLIKVSFHKWLVANRADCIETNVWVLDVVYVELVNLFVEINIMNSEEQKILIYHLLLSLIDSFRQKNQMFFIMPFKPKATRTSEREKREDCTPFPRIEYYHIVKSDWKQEW